jgi:hypothetical protein
MMPPPSPGDDAPRKREDEYDSASDAPRTSGRARARSVPTSSDERGPSSTRAANSLL